MLSMNCQILQSINRAAVFVVRAISDILSGLVAVLPITLPEPTILRQSLADFGGS